MDKPDSQLIANIRDSLKSGSINIFGLPFAGKDTQAERLGQLFKAPVIGGGDILRSHPDQVKIKQLMATGELFPTDFYLQTVLPYLSQPGFLGRPLILSSVGRWKGEERVVIDAAKQAGHPIKAAINLLLDEKELWQRFEISRHNKTRGDRYDDAASVLEVRLEEFKNKTIPVIEYYRQLGLLIEIDGLGPENEVTTRILKELSKLIL